MTREKLLSQTSDKMKVTYSNGVPVSIRIDEVTYPFKRFTSESNTPLYTVVANGFEYCHNSEYSVAIMKYDNIEDIYVSAERNTNKKYSGESDLYPSPSWILTRKTSQR